jgi:hypothetical protein
MFLAFSGVAGLVNLVCLIIVVVKIFQDGKVGLGILGIFCGIFTFIYGWMNVDRYNIRTVMIIWSVAVALSVGAQVMAPHQTVVYPGGTTVTR